MDLRFREFEWHALRGENRPHVLADSQTRLRWFFAAVVLLLFLVLSRACFLEVCYGRRVRTTLNKPIVCEVPLPAQRGRILGRNGAVLADNRRLLSLEVHYRYLQKTPGESWLRQEARRRLSGGQRRDREAVAREAARLRVNILEERRQLAELAGISLIEWNARCAKIERRVERISESVNRRRHNRLAQQRSQQQREQIEKKASLISRIGYWISDALQATTPPIAARDIRVAEEDAYHTVAERISPAVAAQLLADPQRFPSVRVTQRIERVYPRQTLAAHLIGHLGEVEPAELHQPQMADQRNRRLENHPPYAYQPGSLIGRMGLEKSLEQRLRGMPGSELRQVNRRGQLIASEVKFPAQPGQDVVLTLAPELQHSAERLLDSALEQIRFTSTTPAVSGGAIVVLDCQTGELLVSASAPRFSPNIFLSKNNGAVSALLGNKNKPLFDRATRMAIPPGSVMKVLSAVALLEEGVITPETMFHCQGYWNKPEQLRCAIYRHQGIGHGDVTLTDALAFSCNTFFWDHLAELGHQPLIDWAHRFGLGKELRSVNARKNLATGNNLLARDGFVPTPEWLAKRERRRWREADTLMLAIGQNLTTTPLEIATLMAAVGNGGQLVSPRLLLSPGSDDRATLSGTDNPNSLTLPLSRTTINVLREALQKTASDPQGTAYKAFRGFPLDVALKTGTAETGTDKDDHAWAAGFAPADNPQIAFAIALEHGGNAGHTAAPLARRLLEQMLLLGHLGPLEIATQPGLPADR